MKTFIRSMLFLLCFIMLFSSATAANHISFQPEASGPVQQGLAARLTRAFMSVAASNAENVYCLWVSGNLDVRVTDDGTGEYLSSKPGERKSGCSFGYLSVLGDQQDQKMLLFVGDHKTLSFQGSGRGSAGYQLLHLASHASAEETLLENVLTVDPSLFLRYHILPGMVEEETVSFHPLEIGALSPFNGKPTRGSEMPAYGTVKKGTRILAAPDKASQVIAAVKDRTPIEALARDAMTDYLLITFMDDAQHLNRGWIQSSAATLTDHVPELYWLNGSLSLANDVMARRAPTDHAAEACWLSGGTQVELCYAERDYADCEWALVQTSVSGKPALVYIPVEAIAGWTERVPSGFRIGNRVPEYQWTYLLGNNGYTELMCAQPSLDNAGTIVSGRTSAKKSDYPALRGDRDAVMVQLNPEGVPVTGGTFGGSDAESFHWIHTGEDAYYVSGYTRSNNADFEGAWSPSSHRNAAGSTVRSSLALLGKVSPDMEMEWVHTFGTGDKNKSFGFDMVIELADGSLAGCGWMYGSQNSVLDGYGGQDFYIVRMNKAGQILSMDCLGDSAYDVPDSAVATPDGGIIMVGSHRYGNEYSDGMIKILDASMNCVKTVTYGGEGEDTFDNVRALKDGTYVVTGFTNSVSGNGVGASHGGFDFWVMNIDDQGRSIWTKRFGGSGDEELCGTLILEDGSVVLLGSTSSTDGDVQRGIVSGTGKDAWAACVSDSGRLLWQFAAGGKSADTFNAAGLDPSDGGIVLVGMTGNKDAKTAKGYAVKLMVPEQEHDDPDEYVSGISVFDPVDVALIIDISGSMGERNPQTGKTLLSYAQDAAIAFSRTLYALSPASRIGVIAYENSASVVYGLSSADARQDLYTSIRYMTWGGGTNTGSGFDLASQMLLGDRVESRAQLALMLTDGMPNDGYGDPVQYAVACGTALASHSTVYTVGMLGNLVDIETVRRTLNAGYETRYFEVTFQDMAE